MSTLKKVTATVSRYPSTTLFLAYIAFVVTLLLVLQVVDHG